MLLYGIPRVVIGEHQTFRGPEDYLRSRGVVLDVRDDERCIAMMHSFIAERPELWAEDIGVPAVPADGNSRQRSPQRP